jgi:hypothetical protein
MNEVCRTGIKDDEWKGYPDFSISKHSHVIKGCTLNYSTSIFFQRSIKEYPNESQKPIIGI